MDHRLRLKERLAVSDRTSWKWRAKNNGGAPEVFNSNFMKIIFTQFIIQAWNRMNHLRGQAAAFTCWQGRCSGQPTPSRRFPRRKFLFIALSLFSRFHRMLSACAVVMKWEKQNNNSSLRHKLWCIVRCWICDGMDAVTSLGCFMQWCYPHRHYFGSRFSEESQRTPFI